MALTRKSNASSGVQGNPYGAPDGTPSAADYPETLDPAYAAPQGGAPITQVGDPYTDPNQLGIGEEQRERQAPIYSYRVDAGDPEAHYEGIDRDAVARATAETFTPAQQSWQEAPSPTKRFALNPYQASLIPQTRPTETLSPSTYTGLTRDMTGGTPVRMTGEHFSLADHRRMDAEIYGMTPPSRKPSTQRLDTLPWGTNVVNAAPTTVYPNETYNAPVSPPSSSTYRLG